MGIALNPYILLNGMLYALKNGWDRIRMLEFSIETNMIDHSSRDAVEAIMRCSKQRLTTGGTGVSITVNNI